MIWCLGDIRLGSHATYSCSISGFLRLAKLTGVELLTMQGFRNPPEKNTNSMFSSNVDNMELY